MKNTTHGFVNQILLCLLVTIGFGGSIGVGTVWMRHQISATAKRNGELATEFKRLERLIDEKKTVIETEQAPDKLRTLNSVMRLGLVPMNEVPVWLVTENTTQRMAARANRDVLGDYVTTDRALPTAPPIAFKLAQR
jgi:hypothetical protein